jgi:hypothetical protein
VGVAGAHVPEPLAGVTGLSIGWLGRREQAPVAAAPLDVYLVGTAYSGTTHLGGLLSANFGACYAGELGRLPHYVDTYGLFADPVGCLKCAGADRDCELWTQAFVREIEQAGPQQALGRVRERVGARIVVEGSKLPAWLQTSLNGRDPGGARVAVLLTTRSPLSYAMSAQGATGQPLWLSLREWRDIYIDALRTATRTQLPIFVVRNEEVRRDPATVLDRLAPVLGWPERVTTVKNAEPTHSIGGNAFVQVGFGAEGHRALTRAGLHRDGNAFDPQAFERAERVTSVGSLHRPPDVGTARGWAQAAIDCPGLLDIAQLLGYEMQPELEKVVAEAGT